MKIWEKGISTEKIVEQFTVGKDRELDMHLIQYDLKASEAHAEMLGKVGLINSEELESLKAAFKDLQKELKEGKLHIEEEFEDMHSKIEYVLTERTGDAGRKIHTARSRNDQVLVCLHLYAKDEIKEIVRATKVLFDLLQKLSEQYREVLIPGYTHLQAAMPSSFGLWFGSYAETLVDDLYFFEAALKVADQNPLGSAAGYGSSFPIDREFTTQALGFDTLKYNVVAAQMSRGKLEKSMGFAMSSLAGTLGKLAMDVCLYMSQNFNFIGFPDSYTTGSSIMPHKKNPDLFELVRARCSKIQTLPIEIQQITGNLPSGYHRDFQLLKESLIPTVSDLKACLEILTDSISRVEIQDSVIDDPKYDPIFTVEVLNEKVQKGIPFRTAYQEVAESIKTGTYRPSKKLNHTHEGSIGNLSTSSIKEKFDEIYRQIID